MTKPRKLVLLTNPRLVLVSESRDPERFAARFGEVWARMPEAHRELLTRGWRESAGRPPACVELGALSAAGGDVSTDVADGGRTLRFDASLFDTARPQLVRAGIAFVLACASICTGERTQRMNELLDFFAFSLAAEWGFPLADVDARTIDRWVQARARSAARARDARDRRQRRGHGNARVPNVRRGAASRRGGDR